MAIPHTNYYETRYFQPTFIDSNHNDFTLLQNGKTKIQQGSSSIVIWHVRSYTYVQQSDNSKDTRLLPYKFLRITYKKYRNAYEIQFTK